MKHIDAIRTLKPFLDLVLSIKKGSSNAISLLCELAILGTNNGPLDGLIKRRVDRIYFRLCRLQEEMSLLDFKKAKPGVSAEDYVFSCIDFSRYKEVAEADFENLFLEGQANIYTVKVTPAVKLSIANREDGEKFTLVRFGQTRQKNMATNQNQMNPLSKLQSRNR